MGTKSLPAEELEAVKAYTRRLLSERFGNSQTEMAKATGIAQSTISDALSHGKAGPKTLRLLAKAGGVSIDVVLGDAPQRTVELEERYPIRASVLAAASRMGVDPAAIAAVREMRLKGDADPGAEFWMDAVATWVTNVKHMTRALLPAETLDDTDLVEPAPVGRPSHAIALAQDETQHARTKGPGSHVRPTDPDATIRPRDKKKLR